MGAQQADNRDDLSPGLSFTIGTENVRVVFLRAQDFAQRNCIIDTVLNLSSLRNSYQLLYLAAPRLLGATIDAAIFRAHGIGLLLFDERRIDEAVTAQPVHTTFVQATSQTHPSVVTELATLKSMYGEMERTIAKLREDLRDFKDTPRRAEITSEHIRPTSMVSRDTVFAPIDRAGLPSYFSNNPWLDVLSKRGRSENEPIAG
jgi:hypothetical protein